MARATHSVRRGGFYSRGRSSRNTGRSQVLVTPQGTPFGYMLHHPAGGRAVYGLWQGAFGTGPANPPTVQDLLGHTPVRVATTGDGAVSAASLSTISAMAARLAKGVVG